jgi:hypothetical protein
VGPKIGLDYVEKRKFLALPGLELLPLGRPGAAMRGVKYFNLFTI